MNKIYCFLSLSIFLVYCGGQQNGTGTPAFSYTTVTAPAWESLFNRQQGWFGGDGIFAIPSATDEAKQIILFSDTMIGKITGGKLEKGYHMVNNSIAVLEGSAPDSDNILFPIPKGNNQIETSLFPVKLPNKDEGEYYWLGDGFVNQKNANTYIFAYRVIDRPEWTEELFKFEILGSALIILPAGSTFPYTDQRQITLPFASKVGNNYTSFGAGIFENIDVEGYLYIYGVSDPGKRLLVGRVKPDEIEKSDQWQFYNGRDWESDYLHAAAITDSVSNELSVSPLPNGQFALIFQINGIQPKVGLRLGSSPTGPFGPIKEIWDCQEALKEKEFFAYNAKAHPTLSNKGELLVSYNVNSFAFWDQIEDYPNLYRPRFFKIIFDR